MTFEEQVAQFLQETDAWTEVRLQEVTNQNIPLPEDAIEQMLAVVESEITALIEKGFTVYEEKFTPKVLLDYHHLLVERELQKLGVDTRDNIHAYKENAQVALAVMEGKLKPENALLLMEINRAHRQKKKGNENGICEDCVCG
ncbi:MAG: hypothetical protein N3B18_08510, partial [Desulfobacterota bacterium]|nr:hypothetical protein [Thermodesulfobacteriota bacterium]